MRLTQMVGGSGMLSLPLPHRQNRHFWLLPVSQVGPTTLNLISTAASFHVGTLLHRRISNHLGLRYLLQSCLKKFSPLEHVIRLKDVCCERVLQLKHLNNFIQLSDDGLVSILSPNLSFFYGGDNNNFGSDRNSNAKISGRNPLLRRKWTNILLALNVLIYIAQIATEGRLLFWGAKINSLIDRGEVWRLITSSFLHGNPGHLMVNCYSLNSVGPAVENISGAKRFLAIYFISAIASSTTSYWFCKMPAVGASGAVFGLVGSFAVFVLRHRNLVGGGKEELLHIAKVIVLNMVIGMLSNGIDNWGHLGGLVGGAAASWLLGPAWKYEATHWDGRRIFADRAPVFKLLHKKGSKRLR